MLDLLNWQGKLALLLYLCVFIEDLHSKVQIYLNGDKYYFQLHLTNGLYEGHLSKEEVASHLKNLDQLCDDPEMYGLNVGVF